MITKRIIACLDVIGNRVTKAVQFQNNIDIGSVEDVISNLYSAGIDEIIFYDITASSEKRIINLDVVRNVSHLSFVPFTVGGGIKTVNDMYNVLKAGAEKISIDSMAVRNPKIISEGAYSFGSQCIVVSLQAKKIQPTVLIPSGYEVYIDGARKATGLDAVEWAKQAEELGAGECVVNSIDCDGMASGYDITLLKLISSAIRIPVIASGGAGIKEHVFDAFNKTDVSATIVSSMLYSTRFKENFTVNQIKQYLNKNNIPIRI